MWSIIKPGYTYAEKEVQRRALGLSIFGQMDFNLLSRSICENTRTEKQLKKKPEGFLTHVGALIPVLLDIDVWSLSNIQTYHIPFGVRQGHTRDYHSSNVWPSTSVSDNLNRWGQQTVFLVRNHQVEWGITRITFSYWSILAHVQTGVTQCVPEPTTYILSLKLTNPFRNNPLALCPYCACLTEFQIFVRDPEGFVGLLPWLWPLSPHALNLYIQYKTTELCLESCVSICVLFLWTCGSNSVAQMCILYGFWMIIIII